MTRHLLGLGLVVCVGVTAIATPAMAHAKASTHHLQAAAPASAVAAPAPLVTPPAPAPSKAPAATVPPAPAPVLPGAAPAPAAVPPAPVPPAAAAPLAPPVSHGAAPSSTRVAITEFKVEGEDSTPAIAMQLQDGFVVGLTRSAPIYVLDSIDVTRYMNTYPELQKCEGSICIKRLGQLLDVSHLVRVSATVIGNSYSMTARLFSTEGPTPVLVPVATETRSCPVCTADEARQRMVQLGEAIKTPVETWLAAAVPPPPPPPPPSTWQRPLAAVGVAAGFAAIVAGGALLANLDNGKKLPAFAGLLIGLGAGAVATGCYVLITVPSDTGGKPIPRVAIGGTF